MKRKLLTALNFVLGLSLATFVGCSWEECLGEVGEDNTDCAHQYGYPCDIECDLCGYWRDDYEEHTVDDACDVDCNLCGEEIEPEHEYDDEYDVDCNLCGEEREVEDEGDGSGDDMHDCADEDGDHLCDVCEEELSECADEDNDHLCDVCEEELSECADDDNDHLCDICEAELSECVDDDNDHLCDICEAELSECVDAENDGDHTCDVCDSTEILTDHVFDNANDVDCNECGYEKEVITLSNVQDIDLDLTYNDGLVYSTNNATLNISVEANIESVSSVVYNESAIEGASYENGTLSIPKAAFGTAYGESTIVINGEDADGDLFLINVPVLLITQVITTADELDAMYNIAEALVADTTAGTPGKSHGYFALGENITYNKAYSAWPTWQNQAGHYKWGSPNNVGFSGTFDGRGYTVDGMTISNNYSAFIPLLQKDGVIKNVGFTNAVLAGTASGFVCAWGTGTIENVYVQYAEGTFGVAGGYNGTFFATDNVRSVAVGGGLTIKNCFVDASLITTVGVAQGKGRFIGYVADVDNAYVTLEGVYAIGNKYEGTNANGYNLGKNVGNANCGWFETSAKMLTDSATQTELATWDTTYWTIVNGVPTWGATETV